MNIARRVEKYGDAPETEFYYYWYAGVWYLNLPGCGLANLGNHTVVEHEDGTITASPSILTTGCASGKSVQKHGFLERGIWRDC